MSRESLERMWANSPSMESPKPADTPEFHEWMADHAAIAEALTDSTDDYVQGIIDQNIALTEKVKRLEEKIRFLRMFVPQPDERSTLQRWRDRLIYLTWDRFSFWVRRFQ